MGVRIRSLTRRKSPTRRTSRTKSRSKIKSPSSGMTAWCMRCKAKHAILGGKMTTSSRGTRMLKGKCKTCGSGVCRIVGR